MFYDLLWNNLFVDSKEVILICLIKSWTDNSYAGFPEIADAMKKDKVTRRIHEKQRKQDEQSIDEANEAWGST